MQIIKVNNSAFTLLEVLVSAIIFVISVAGLFATLNAVRGPVINKENQLAAAVFGRQVLEALYSQVNDATYDIPCGSSPCPNFDLSVGPHQVSPATLQSSSGLTFPSVLTSCNPNLLYTVSCADGSASCNASSNVARGVNLSILWPDATGAC